jgi:hypothetical protein
MEYVQKMQREIEEKLKQVTEQVDNKKAKEFTDRIKLLEQEQIVMSQVRLNCIHSFLAFVLIIIDLL